MYIHNSITNESIRLENEQYNQNWIKKYSLIDSETGVVKKLDVSKKQQLDSSPFMVVWLKNIDRLLKLLPSDFDHKDYTLLDVGCGSGISTIYFYKNSQFKNYVGFDFSNKLISSAEKNKKKLVDIGEIENEKDLNFINCDALDFKINQKVCIFMFNPFGCKTVLNFIKNNISHLKNTHSFLLYANDRCINEISDLSKVYKRDSIYNLSIVKF